MVRKMLSDAVMFSSVHTDRFKSNYLSVSYMMPFDKKTMAMCELALKILKRGTKSYPDMISLSQKLDDLYAADLYTKSTVFGDVLVLSFCMEVLNNDYVLDDTDVQNETLALLFEMIYEPITENGVFSEAYFQSEKQNLLDDIDAGINNKAKYAFSRFSEHMFAGEKCRKYSFSDRDMVAALRNEEVFMQYQNMIRHSEIQVFFVGQTDNEDLEARLSDAFCNRFPTDTLPTGTEVIRTVDSVKEIRETCVGNQGNLVMGFRTGTVLADGDYPRMALLSELYGGGASSKLFMNVREKMSLCYYCASIPEATKGAMFVRAGIENANYERAKAEILRQLEQVKQGNFTEDELETAKLSLINAYREISDSPQSIQNWYIGRILSGITQSPEEVIEIVRGTTKEEIQATAEKIVPDTIYFLEGIAKGENA